MLDAYIKVDDIKKLLDEATTINGLIKRSDFQKAVIGLKEYKKPIDKPIIRLNKVRDMISSITTYQNNIRAHKEKSPICIYIEEKGVRVEKLDKITIEGINTLNKESITLSEENILLSKTHLIDVIGITAPTLSKYINKKIVNREIYSMWIYVNGNCINENCEPIYIKCFNLANIKSRLKCFK